MPRGSANPRLRKIRTSTALPGGRKLQPVCAMPATGALSAAMTDSLDALSRKIAKVLGVKPQCFITQRAELAVLKTLSDTALADFATERGWRVVRRVGGRQIEFYNDVSARLQREMDLS